MSVSGINSIRLILLPGFTVAFFVFFALTLKNKREVKISSVLLKLTALCLSAVTAFSAVLLPAFSFKANDQFNELTGNVSMEKLNMDMFEFSPYEEYGITDRWVTCKESECDNSNRNTTVWFIIQPKDTYLQTASTNEGFLYHISERLCLTEGKNEYGTIRIYPVCLDRYYESFFILDFYGTIVIPVNQEFDLVIEYICDSNMTECKNYIYSELKALLKSN